MKKIFDCITFFNENFMANLRFEILNDEVDLIDVGISIRGELTRLNRKESLFIFVKLCERDFHEYDLLHDQDLKENMKKILELNLIYEGRNQNAHGNFIGESVDVNQCFELLDTTLKLLSL